jgi:hypothetical protein
MDLTGKMLTSRIAEQISETDQIFRENTSPEHHAGNRGRAHARDPETVKYQRRKEQNNLKAFHKTPSR